MAYNPTVEAAHRLCESSMHDGKSTKLPLANTGDATAATIVPTLHFEASQPMATVHLFTCIIPRAKAQPQVTTFPLRQPAPAGLRQALRRIQKQC